jgi:hypothetical protein
MFGKRKRQFRDSPVFRELATKIGRDAETCMVLVETSGVSYVCTSDEQAHARKARMHQPSARCNKT